MWLERVPSWWCGLLAQSLWHQQWLAVSRCPFPITNALFETIVVFRWCCFFCCLILHFWQNFITKRTNWSNYHIIVSQTPFNFLFIFCSVSLCSLQYNVLSHNINKLILFNNLIFIIIIIISIDISIIIIIMIYIFISFHVKKKIIRVNTHSQTPQLHTIYYIIHKMQHAEW